MDREVGESGKSSAEYDQNTSCEILKELNFKN